MRFRRTSRCISISIWRGPRKGFLTSAGYSRWAVDGVGERRFRERRGVKGGRRWGEEEEGGGKEEPPAEGSASSVACPCRPEQRAGVSAIVLSYAQTHRRPCRIATSVRASTQIGCSADTDCPQKLIAAIVCSADDAPARHSQQGPDYPRSSFSLHALYGSAMPEPVSCWRTAVARFIRKAERMDEWEKERRGAWERERRRNGVREC